MTSPVSVLAPLLDGALAGAAVLAAYWLRFDPDVREVFAPAASRTALLVAFLLPLACGVAGLYGRRVRTLWPLRLIAGATVAFGLAFALVWATTGLEAVSRISFVVAAVLAIFASGGWRAVAGLIALWRRDRRQPDSAFEDRSEPAPSLGAGVLHVLRSRELVRNLVLKDLKLKYRGSALGFLWSLANPVLMLMVYSLAFTYILRIDKPAFVYFLLVGLLAWTFFAQTVGMATGSISESAGLLKSVRFPRAVLPLSTLLFNLVQYLLTFGVLLPIMLVAFGITPGWTMLAYPPLLVLLVLFVTGAALIVATAATYFRDVKHLVEVALAVMFWTTPILYDLQDVPERLRLPILFSPMSPFVTALHDMFYSAAWPDATIWLTAGAWAAITFISGLTLFLSFEDRFVEQI